MQRTMLKTNTVAKTQVRMSQTLLSALRPPDSLVVQFLPARGLDLSDNLND